MKQYPIVLICKGLMYETVMTDAMYDDEDLMFTVQNVKISLDFTGSLYIENPADYRDEQLDFLTLYPKHDVLFLMDYNFSYLVPVALLNRGTGEVVKTNIIGKISHEGAPDAAIPYSYQLLHAQTTRSDLEYAMDDLQCQLKNSFSICICACCRYGQDHPYGGDIYLNYCCFKKSKRDYLQLPNGVGKQDWAFFSDTQSVESTRPFYSCDEFEARP